MRIALLACDRHPVAPPFAGGLESFTWHLAAGLRSRGHEAVVFAGEGAHPALEVEHLHPAPLRLSDAARADIAMPPEAQVRSTIAYVSAMRTLAERGDIDLVHNNSLHYVPIALAPTLPMPMLTTLHTPPHPWLEPVLRHCPGAPTAAVSAAVARQWAGITDARVVRNGIDLDAWPPGPGGPALVWSGRIVPEKAPHLAARIARDAGLPLRIAGPIGDRDYHREGLQPLLDERIEHVGHLSPPELAALVGSSAACLVTPAWDEPYGLVAAEAMACGTPVLAIGRGGLPEIVHSGGGRLVPAGASVGEAVEALAAVLALDRAGVRAHAERHCSIGAMLDRYLELYDGLVA